ncbi:malto-oligosyltrehalose synthase [Streptomyces purpureus]|uniref:Malto-oligosyltrehalose synthase n=1 Tax=Streptomyces purpureus TaxID=1951 RepID=A0A918GYS3_9ACTN|nr:malto-oligosyltrehalose synthase [Streptomyces purpureus]GGT18306.1 malto-oligosyltrehalose synthase [Streptomyces purpureus]
MTPIATYRLQLRPDFTFQAAARAVPYLASLGVSHLHLSPVLEALPGSTHGYDVTGHSRIRGELGGEEGLRRLAAAALRHGLGLVVDLVPNHMSSVARHNRALWEVLREGPASPYARWFDIDWDAGGGKVLLPVLGGRIGDVRDRLRVEPGEGPGSGVLRYEDHVFPLRDGTASLPFAELLDAQWYRLGWWRLARTELNYRRFFTISELIGVRVEDPEVFAATHGKVLELVREGVIEGLRIDHPDGLADPEAYLERLHAATGGRCWTVVEKILTGEERLPARWPVDGTTGYDALRYVDGLFVDGPGAERLTEAYRAFAGPAPDRGGIWEPTVRRAMDWVVTHELATELSLLTRTAGRICAADPVLRDHAPWALRTATTELMVRLPVYRPYRIGGQEVLTEEAAREAKETFAVEEEAVAVDVIRDLALGRLGEGPDHTAFRARFAQTASALRAKSVEDTAFYRYTPLLSANEVGGDPGRPAVSPQEFHGYAARLARDWPATGTVLSTHDTKRGGDVRAAIAVLSQCPERWARLLDELTAASPVPAPDPHLAWSAWQTAFGLGPDLAAVPGRPGDALLKAVREAGLRTTWTEPDPGYEQAVTDFVAAWPPGGPPELTKAVRELAPHTRANALGAALVQLTMPGVPELYQGTERTCRTLVDPDNRRPFTAGEPDERTALTRAALRLRRQFPEIFGDSGRYAPLTAAGPAADHCLAFVRSGAVVTAVTRLSLRLAESGGWAGTVLELPDGPWFDLLAGQRRVEGGAVVLAELFADRPVALLSRLAVPEEPSVPL